MTDSDWILLERHFDAACTKWLRAVKDTNRQIGFVQFPRGLYGICRRAALELGQRRWRAVMAVVRLVQGEQLAASFIRGWQDNDLPSARPCALKIGHLVAGTLLTYSRGKQLVEVTMGTRKLPEELWQEVMSAFNDGRDTITNSGDVVALYAPPIAANDNVKDDSIDAETLLGMTFTPLEYVIPGYVVEGLTVLGGKPKLGKSWWAYDASIAVSTGGRAMGV